MGNQRATKKCRCRRSLGGGPSGRRRAAEGLRLLPHAFLIVPAASGIDARPRVHAFLRTGRRSELGRASSGGLKLNALPTAERSGRGPTVLQCGSLASKRARFLLYQRRFRLFAPRRKRPDDGFRPWRRGRSRTGAQCS